MAELSQLDGRGLKNWATRAVSLLTARRAEINALNVFPVPDADTGSNMAHTMDSALAEANKLSESDLEDASAVATALSVGSVRGARGNSGVVLSQVLRGVAHAAAGGPLDGEAVIDALNVALDMVLKAIQSPVDGTVITVLRATAAAVNSLTDRSLASVVRTAVEAAQIALQKTPSQLKVLRDAGVVDAGGQGFVVILEALAEEVTGVAVSDRGASISMAVRSHVVQSDAHELEVMFHVADADLTELQDQLGGMGDSLVVGRESDDSARVHIHTRDAGAVIEFAFRSGTISDLRIEVLPIAASPSVASTPKRLVVAVAPAGELAELYRQSGAVVVVRDSGDVVSEIVGAVRAAAVDEVILLPNGMLEYGELVNAEIASHAVDATMNILPTSRLVSGLAALAVHDPRQPLAADTYAMAEAAASTRTAVLQRAAKAMLTQAGAVSRGDFLVLSGMDVQAVSENLQQAVEDTVLWMLQGGGGELVTLLVNEEAEKLLSEEALRDSLGSRSHIELMVYPAEGMEQLVEIGVE